MFYYLWPSHSTDSKSLLGNVTQRPFQEGQCLETTKGEAGYRRGAGVFGKEIPRNHEVEFAGFSADLSLSLEWKPALQYLNDRLLATLTVLYEIWLTRDLALSLGWCRWSFWGIVLYILSVYYMCHSKASGSASAGFSFQACLRRDVSLTAGLTLSHKFCTCVSGLWTFLITYPVSKTFY